jgi:hypothetical protein
MSQKLNTAIAVAGIDIGKNSFHVIGLDKRGAIVLRQKCSRGQVEARFANMPPCLIGMEACVGAHHLSRKLKSLGHDARLMPAKYVRPYSKGQKNDFRDGEAIAEAVQRPTMRFVATKTVEQLDLQALHHTGHLCPLGKSVCGAADDWGSALLAGPQGFLFYRSRVRTPGCLDDPAARPGAAWRRTLRAQAIAASSNS